MINRTVSYYNNADDSKSDCHYDVKYNSFMDDFNIKCIHCGNNQLEVWDEKHCPKCGEEMVWGGDWGRNFLIAEWD